MHALVNFQHSFERNNKHTYLRQYFLAVRKRTTHCWFFDIDNVSYGWGLNQIHAVTQSFTFDFHYDGPKSTKQWVLGKLLTKYIS